jgi:hypothetical protein
MGKDDKKFLRELKRTIKRKGNRKRRQFYRQSLRDPATAHEAEFEFKDGETSTFLNGIDRDVTHQVPAEGDPVRPPERQVPLVPPADVPGPAGG